LSTSKCCVVINPRDKFQRKPKRAKLSKVIDDEEHIKVDTVISDLNSSENSIAGANQVEYEAPEMITKEETIESSNGRR
jgi:hypothetical protein